MRELTRPLFQRVGIIIINSVMLGDHSLHIYDFYYILLCICAHDTAVHPCFTVQVFLCKLLGCMVVVGREKCTGGLAGDRLIVDSREICSSTPSIILFPRTMVFPDS